MSRLLLHELSQVVAELIQPLIDAIHVLVLVEIADFHPACKLMLTSRNFLQLSLHIGEFCSKLVLPLIQGLHLSRSHRIILTQARLPRNESRRLHDALTFLELLHLTSKLVHHKLHILDIGFACSALTFICVIIMVGCRVLCSDNLLEAAVHFSLALLLLFEECLNLIDFLAELLI